IPRADAVIFVTGFDSPLTEAEAGFLATAARHAGQLFLVLNKRDLASDRDAADALEFIRCRLREDLDLGELRLYTLSALEALEAVVQDDRTRLDDSGLAPLHAALTEFLATDKTRVFLCNVAERAAGLVAGQRRDLRLGRLALDGGPDPPGVLAAFDARMSELGQQQRAVAAKVAARIEAKLANLLAARSPGWQAGLRELLDPCAEDALSAAIAAGDGTVRGLLEDARGRLERAGREVAGGWLERRAGEVQELITGMVAGEIGVLLELSRAPRTVGAEIAGLATAQDRPRPRGWSAEDVPGLVVQWPKWTIQLELPRRSRRKADAGDTEIRRRLADALAAAIGAFETSTRDEFRDAAADWAIRVQDQATRQSAQAADRFRRCLQTVPRDEDLAALDDLAARLTGFLTALGARDPFPGEDTAGRDLAPGIITPAGSGRADGCVVCEQMDAALADYLRRHQFRLATRDHDQARHALAGGFCPAHTWQYAAIASPLGISAGYAKLAATVADALESIGQHAATAADQA
ncbi:MAG: hypothetical protein ACRDOE_10865, partial [Streptosporangiaceae bacterium]